MSSTPLSTNFLQSTQFSLVFPKISETTYFCQGVTIPGVYVADIPQFTPFHDMYRAGDKINYDLLMFTFIVDDKLQGWRQIHNWMRGLTFPDGFREYQKIKKDGLYSDCILTILSSLNNPILRFNFKNCFPTSLSPLYMSTLDKSTEPVTADVTVRFDTFDIVDIK